jgi:hypothetical protein
LKRHKAILKVIFDTKNNPLTTPQILFDEIFQVKNDNNSYKNSMIKLHLLIDIRKQVLRNFHLKFKFFSLWFDLTLAQTHDLSHSRQALSKFFLGIPDFF